MKPSRAAPADASGFTILEVLAAFVVFAVTLAALLQLFSGGLRDAQLADEYARAVMIAQSRLAGYTAAERLEETSASGSRGRLRVDAVRRRLRRAPGERRTPIAAGTTTCGCGCCAWNRRSPGARPTGAIATCASRRSCWGRSRERAARARRGFTLLETVVALTLLAVMLGDALRGPAHGHPRVGRGHGARRPRRPGAARLRPSSARSSPPRSRGASRIRSR